jgi:phosphatidylserine decarboxylase
VFRDPERYPREDGMVSPADGRIVRVDGRGISIRMNLYDVHVNRSPIDGTVKMIEYIKGNFKPVFMNSDQNERNIIEVSTGHGEVRITQIAGILARRIVCYVKEGDILKRGERIGKIRFGSRVDVSIPEAFEIVAKRGERVKAGESIIARI